MEQNEWTEMSFEKFLQNITRLDWHYRMSDDSNAYARGRKNYEDYRELATQNGTKWIKAFADESKKHSIS